MSERFDIDASAPGTSLAKRPYQVLSLTGGGYRGLYTAAILEALETRAGRPLGQIFDLITGTSIGGILAIGLAAGVPAATLRQTFEARGDEIFPTYYRFRGRRILPRFRLGLFEVRYNVAGLTKAIEECLQPSGKTELSQITSPALIAVAVDVTNVGPRLFEAPDNESGISLLDAALATSAAPGYFPEHRIGQSIYVDGGLVANAPDMVGLARALSLGHAVPDIRMLSIGTAGGTGGEIPRRPTRRGLLYRGIALFNVTLSAQQKLAVRMASSVLRRNHIRVDAEPSAAQAKAIGLDSVGRRASDTLQLFASNSVQSIEQDHQAQFREMFSRTAA